MKHLTFDYFIHNNVLSKSRMKEAKHLMWSYGGVPAIDKTIYDSNRKDFDHIRFHTDKGRTFEISAEVFDQYRVPIDYNFGAQYIVDKKHWTITGLPKPENKQMKLL